jgi:hypothetical protein
MFHRAALPARLYDSGNLTAGCKTSEAQTTDSEFPDKSPGSAAQRTPIVGANFEFRLPLTFRYQ